MNHFQTAIESKLQIVVQVQVISHRLLARLLVGALFPALDGRGSRNESEDDVLPLAPDRAAQTALVFLPTYRALEEVRLLLLD